MKKIMTLFTMLFPLMVHAYVEYKGSGPQIMDLGSKCECDLAGNIVCGAECCNPQIFDCVSDASPQHCRPKEPCSGSKSSCCEYVNGVYQPKGGSADSEEYRSCVCALDTTKKWCKTDKVCIGKKECCSRQDYFNNNSFVSRDPECFWNCHTKCDDGSWIQEDGDCICTHCYHGTTTCCDPKTCDYNISVGDGLCCKY